MKFRQITYNFYFVILYDIERCDDEGYRLIWVKLMSSTIRVAHWGHASWLFRAKLLHYNAPWTLKASWLSQKLHKYNNYYVSLVFNEKCLVCIVIKLVIKVTFDEVLTIKWHARCINLKIPFTNKLDYEFSIFSATRRTIVRIKLKRYRSSRYFYRSRSLIFA